MCIAGRGRVEAAAKAIILARGQDARGGARHVLAGLRGARWEAGYRRDGYEVKRVSDTAADFEIRKDWRTALVSGKRWKVARTGIEPLRELKAAKDLREAHDCVYITIGEITDNARQFALDNKIMMVGGAELARLLPRAVVR